MSGTKASLGDLDVRLRWPGAGAEDEGRRPGPPAPNGSPASGESRGPGVDELLGVLVAEVRSMREELRQLADAVRCATSPSDNTVEKPEKPAGLARRTARNRPPSS